DTDLVRTGFEHLYEVYEKIDPKGAHLLEESEPYVLTYLDFPKEHAHWIRTNNLCERLNKEIKKRTRVVGVFPSKQAMLRLVGAVCINQNEEWFVATHFMDKRSLLFEECPKRESCTQETIDHLLQVIDSDFNACKEVA
ncbi:MAG: transposase, partial [Atopobium sp.]|nr:transposase [Atopobium sp.]